MLWERYLMLGWAWGGVLAKGLVVSGLHPAEECTHSFTFQARVYFLEQFKVQSKIEWEGQKYPIHLQLLLPSLPLSSKGSFDEILFPKVKVAQSCSTLCNPVDYTVHGLLQARILERVAFPFSKGSFQPKDWTKISHIAGRVFTSWATKGLFKKSMQILKFCFYLEIIAACMSLWFIGWIHV